MDEEAARLNAVYGQGTVTLLMQDTYYNMYDVIKEHWDMVEKAHQAIRLAGLEPTDVPVRGGTDGASLSYKGLPCPNIGTGGYNWHGEYECISVEGMDQVVEILEHLVRLYAG